jgi:hypothetical protein
MPPNFGLLPELPERIRDKRRRYGAYRDRALAAISELVLNGNRTGAGSSGDLALSAPSRG